MAHKDGKYVYSDEDTLGEYEFYVMSSADPVANKTYIHAQCKKGDAITIQSAEVDGVAELVSFHIDANDTTADVYAKVKQQTLDTGPVSVPFPSASSGSAVSADVIWTYSAPAVTNAYHDFHHPYHIFACDSPGQSATGSYVDTKTGEGQSKTWSMDSSFTYNGKTVYYFSGIGAYWLKTPTLSPLCAAGEITLTGSQIAAICWIMVYGEPSYDDSDILIARFAIDLETAGGTGEDSDWDDPGDEDPPSDEPDPPTYTLHLDVTGALSGRHNDPLNDTSYSYTPDDKATVAGYGCGGDGGHGGGGGGGASTVVVHKFATSRASSKAIIAKAKRHGYGSGGGKGGKGGDGCIIIYY